MLGLISSFTISVRWYFGLLRLLRLLLRSMRSADAIEPAAVGHGGSFVGVGIAKLQGRCRVVESQLGAGKGKVAVKQ